MKHKTWINHWNENNYLQIKQKTFEIVDNYLQIPPKRILDIGCGLALESNLFQKKYNCELYLLEGDFETTKNNNRCTSYGTAESMSFYSKLEVLKNLWNSNGLKYNFLDANNLCLNLDVKFDLVYSFLSCGFHYPISTYIDFLKKHTTDKTTIIVDIRRKKFKEQKEYFTVLKNLNSSAKSDLLSIKLK